MASGPERVRLTRHPGPPPAVVAERVAKMHAAGPATRRGAHAGGGGGGEGGGAGGRGGVRRTTPTRLWTVALLHLGGYELPAIARALGYANHTGPQKALKHPAV